MRTTAWILKYVFLPLTPFLVGALVRGLYDGAVTLNLLSPSELSFSMAMMSLVLSIKTAQLDDNHLRDALTSLYQVGVVAFLALFAVAMFLETDASNVLHTLHAAAKSSVATGVKLTQANLPDRVESFGAILDRLRVAVLCLAFIVVPFTVIAVRRYDLDRS